ncbi:MAG: hypothetical protein Q8P18_11240 [Pseudomonadota bacterium]|nr:hypothetical protein [Pseudomonadota bacterium]
MLDPVRSAPAHPLALAAAALIVVNDFVLRVHAPGWVTGKLSDAGWLVVAPVFVAAVASWVGVPGRFARVVGLVVAGGTFTTLQLWPPLGAWFRADHVADAGDLLVLPALLGAVLAWRGTATRPWAASAALPVLAGALLATSYGGGWAGSSPCGDDEEWDPAEPLLVEFNHFDVPLDTDHFVRGFRLTDEDGAEVPFVLARDGTSETRVLLCARDGLRGATSYAWEIGPWGPRTSNELGFVQDAYPTVRFRTWNEDGPPAADAAACAALSSGLDIPERCVLNDMPRADTGDTGDTAR